MSQPMPVGVKVENTVPGGVYLCQVGERVSCGACCGLYNVENPSPKALEALLTHRTAVFFFHDALYGPPPIDYEALGAPPSRYDVVLRALQARFGCAGELAESEDLLDDIIDRLASRIISRSPNGCRVLSR